MLDHVFLTLFFFENFPHLPVRVNHSIGGILELFQNKITFIDDSILADTEADLCPGVENGEYFGMSAPSSSDYHSDLSDRDQDHSPRGRQPGAGLGAGRQLSVDRAGRHQPRQARVVADYSRKHFTEVSSSSSWHIYISNLSTYINSAQPGGQYGGAGAGGAAPLGLVAGGDRAGPLRLLPGHLPQAHLARNTCWTPA